MSARRRQRHSPEQIVHKLRDAEAMLNAVKDFASVLQALELLVNETRPTQKARV